MRYLLPIIIICGILLVVAPVLAEETASGSVIIPDPLGEKEFTDVIAAIVNLIVTIGIGIGTIMIIWAGIMYMTAGANEEKVTKARKALMWAVIGIAILLSAKFIIDLLKELFKGESESAYIFYLFKV